MAGNEEQMHYLTLDTLLSMQGLGQWTIEAIKERMIKAYGLPCTLLDQILMIAPTQRQSKAAILDLWAAHRTKGTISLFTERARKWRKIAAAYADAQDSDKTDSASRTIQMHWPHPPEIATPDAIEKAYEIIRKNTPETHSPG